MPGVDPGELKTWVNLEMNDSVAEVSFSPNRIKVGMVFGGRSSETVHGWRCSARFHPQVTLNTVLVTDTGRRVHVKGHSNPGNLDRSGWMVLECDEVLTQ